MDYFFPFVLFIFYKLIALIPLVLILIGIIKLQRNGKNSATRLMLTGNLGLIVKIILLDSLVDYFVRFSDHSSINNVSSIYTVLSFTAIVFSILFAAGFLIFVISFSKKTGS